MSKRVIPYKEKTGLTKCDDPKCDGLVDLWETKDPITLTTIQFKR